nr:rRNA biogenesis protein RRP5 [Tanacetum cinerariifolium]
MILHIYFREKDIKLGPLLHLESSARVAAMSANPMDLLQGWLNVQAEVTKIKSLELKLKFGYGLHGRIHITEESDEARG